MDRWHHERLRFYSRNTFPSFPDDCEAAFGRLNTEKTGFVVCREPTLKSDVWLFLNRAFLGPS